MVLHWLQRKGLDEVTKTYLATNGPNHLRKDKAARQEATNELESRGWLRATAQGWRVFKNSSEPPANANSANSANSDAENDEDVARQVREISGFSGISVSGHDKPFFQPEQNDGYPVTNRPQHWAIDAAQNITTDKDDEDF